MKFHKKFMVSAFALALSFIFLFVNVNEICAADFYYATINMSWAEFYAGETGDTAAQLEAAGLDAITSPTTHAIVRFPLLTSHSDDKGSEISGVKNVQVRMTEAVYNSLSETEKSRYTFTDEVFTEYKPVNEDGSFGKMVSEIKTLDSAVTIATGASSRWGNYTLNIAKTASIDIGIDPNIPNDKTARKYLGATLTTSDGTIYALRHDCNLWSSAGEIAFCVSDDYVEPHLWGVKRDFDYTASLNGKTITKITYLLKDIPDIEISGLNLYVKKQTSAKVAQKNPTLQPAEILNVELEFSDVPSGANYNKVSSVTYYDPAARRQWATLDAANWSFANNTLTITGDTANESHQYRVIFQDSNNEYYDIKTDIFAVDSSATEKIVSSANNNANVTFLLTPYGTVQAVDEELTSNKFVNASDYTTPANNSTSVYTGGTNEVEGSGFGVNIALSGVSSDWHAVVGLMRTCTVTPENLGANYSRVYNFVNGLPGFEYGGVTYRIVSSFADLNNVGLRVMARQADGTTRDVSKLISVGIVVTDANSIALQYGTMIADCATSAITEGRYALSIEDDGELLMADGVKDNNLNLSLYIAQDATGSVGSSGGGCNASSSLAMLGLAIFFKKFH